MPYELKATIVVGLIFLAVFLFVRWVLRPRTSAQRTPRGTATLSHARTRGRVRHRSGDDDPVFVMDDLPPPNRRRDERRRDDDGDAGDPVLVHMAAARFGESRPAPGRTRTDDDDRRGGWFGGDSDSSSDGGDGGD